LHLVIYQGLTRRDLPHPGRNFTRPNTNVVNLAAEHRIKPRFRPEKEKQIKSQNCAHYRRRQWNQAGRGDCIRQGSADVEVVLSRGPRDAQERQHLVEEHRTKCLLIDRDVGDEKFCQKAVKQTVSEFGKIEILVNNAAEQHPQKSIQKISEKHLEKLSAQISAIISMFFRAKAAMKHLEKGAAIVDTVSFTAYKSSPALARLVLNKGQSSPLRVLAGKKICLMS